MHMSNTLPDFRVALTRDSKWEAHLLFLGRIVTLNIVQTKEGWSYAGGILLAFIALQVMLVAKALVDKRRHLSALEEVKKL